MTVHNSWILPCCVCNIDTPSSGCHLEDPCSKLYQCKCVFHEQVNGSHLVWMRTISFQFSYKDLEAMNKITDPYHQKAKYSLFKKMVTQFCYWIPLRFNWNTRPNKNYCLSRWVNILHHIFTDSVIWNMILPKYPPLHDVKNIHLEI